MDGMKYSSLIMMDDPWCISRKMSVLPTQAPPYRLAEEKDGSFLSKPDNQI